MTKQFVIHSFNDIIQFSENTTSKKMLKKSLNVTNCFNVTGKNYVLRIRLFDFQLFIVCTLHLFYFFVNIEMHLTKR